MNALAVFQSLTPWQIAAGLIVAIIIGIGKTGISGIVLLAIPILASAFGAIESTGLMLAMFLIGDLFAVQAYARHGNWQEIRKLLPPALVGLVIGSIVGRFINDQQFKYLIASIVLLCLIAMIWQEGKGDQFQVPDRPWFVILVGVLSGFATMIGNAAGPIFAIYLLAIRLNKQSYLGTTAWFFLIINLTKLPLQIFVWHNMTAGTALLAIAALPAIFLGTRIGIWIIRRLPEKTFRYLIIAMTALVAARMFF
jgi:uncharacterized membrane protein YfcA